MFLIQRVFKKKIEFLQLFFLFSLSAFIIVTRVQPRTSKGITDLFLPPTSSQFSCVVSESREKRFFTSLHFIFKQEDFTFARRSPIHPQVNFLGLKGMCYSTICSSSAPLFSPTKVSFVNGINQTPHGTN